MGISSWRVGWFALITALATGLGALPFLIRRHPKRHWLGRANALAAGLMLAASFGLIYEGLDQPSGEWRVLAGLIAGMAFILLSKRWLDHHPGISVANLKGADARDALLIFGVMTLHSFTEGVGVGVSFGGGEKLGVYIATAIALHNIPEGLAISLTMVPKGTPVWKAGLYAIASSLPQPLMALPAFWFVEVFAPLLPVGLGFAAGAMLWMVFAEIIPEALEEETSGNVGLIVTLGIASMTILQAYLH
ncbi:MAG: ZIP family metal transporter [Opitutales bacterium]